MTVRPQRASDAAAVRRVLTDAFGSSNTVHGAHVADLAEALLAGPSRVALVAEVDDAVVGHVQLSRCWLDAPRELVEVLVLSPLGVAGAHQGTGVGGQLVRDALKTAEQQGATLVFLEGEPGYYPRFGFEQGRSRGFTPPSMRIPDAAFQVVVMPAWRHWMTGALVYCDEFWQHDAVGLRST